MVRPAKLQSDLGVKVPSGQAPMHPEAGSGAGQRCPVLSGATKASERGKRIHSPQHKVKSAASTYSQPKGVWEGRAAHITAKATDSMRESERVLDLPGVWDAGWGEGAMRDRRDPSAQPRRQGGSYKPKAKSRVVQRESEGAIVPLMVAEQNATGGKGPYFGRASKGGKGEGMDRETGPNDPGRHELAEHARELRRALWALAKRQRDRYGCGARHVRKAIGKPCAGKPHARFERGASPLAWIAGTLEGPYQ